VWRLLLGTAFSAGGRAAADLLMDGFPSFAFLINGIFGLAVIFGF